MSLRSERSNTHDCLAEIAQKIFPKESRRRGNLFYIGLGRYRIKLKKFDERLVTASYPTQAVLEFLAQVARKLFDYDLENLQLGYVPTGLSVTDYSIRITKPKRGGRPEWEYELRAAASAVAAPVLAATDPHVPAKTRVQAKPAKFKKVEKDRK